MVNCSPLLLIKATYMDNLGTKPVSAMLPKDCSQIQAHRLVGRLQSSVMFAAACHAMLDFNDVLFEQEQVAPEVDPALRQQIEDMGFSANKCVASDFPEITGSRMHLQPSTRSCTSTVCTLPRLTNNSAPLLEV